MLGKRFDWSTSLDKLRELWVVVSPSHASHHTRMEALGVVGLSRDGSTASRTGCGG